MTSAVRLTCSFKVVEFDTKRLDRLPASAPMVQQMIGVQPGLGLAKPCTQSRSETQ
jgi:hypothetical protein